MGACNSLFSSKRQDEEDEKEGRMLALLEENRKLHEIVSSLQMELHQQRYKVSRMSYIVEKERRLVVQNTLLEIENRGLVVSEAY